MLSAVTAERHALLAAEADAAVAAWGDTLPAPLVCLLLSLIANLAVDVICDRDLSGPL